MLTTDRVGGIALIPVALFVLWESRQLPLGTLSNPGPAYMPVVLAILLLVFGGLIVLTGARADPLGAIGWGEWRHAIAIFVVCAFAGWALERFGYRLTVTASLAFLLGLIERKGIVVTIAFALTFAFGTFFLFNTLLKTPLPRGPFGL